MKNTEDRLQSPCDKKIFTPAVLVVWAMLFLICMGFVADSTTFSGFLQGTFWAFVVSFVSTLVARNFYFIFNYCGDLVEVMKFRAINRQKQ